MDGFDLAAFRRGELTYGQRRIPSEPFGDDNGPHRLPICKPPRARKKYSLNGPPRKFCKARFMKGLKCYTEARSGCSYPDFRLAWTLVSACCSWV